jgi:hypothetical protein
MRNDELAALHSITPIASTRGPQISLPRSVTAGASWALFRLLLPPALDRLRDLLWDDLGRAGQRREIKISLSVCGLAECRGPF